MINLGEAAQGPQLDGRGELLLDSDGSSVREGTVLALMDPTRYQQQVTAAELAIASTDREIDALVLELDEVFPARIESAKASVASAAADVSSARESVNAAQSELDLAETTVERDRVLIESGAIAQSVLDESESSFQTASASLAQAQSALDASLQSEQSTTAGLAETQGDFSVRQADLASLRAARAELVNALDQAKTDLASCILRAPFQGRVTARHVERGGYANAGTAVVELTMETVVKVVITVSAEEERRIALGDRLPIYTDMFASDAEPARFMGTVFEKASVADTGTRTFRIGLILPNPLLSDGDSSPSARLASVSEFFPVLRMPDSPDGAMFINVASVFEKNGSPHVLVLPPLADTSASVGSVQVPRAVPVELTDEWEQFDKWTLRRIRATGDLQSGDGLVLDPQPSDEAGVRIGAVQYAFRPGDVVQVGADTALPQEGFWVHTAAIVPRTGDNLVFTVEDGVASEVLVDVLETSGSFRRISAPALREGMQVVVVGMQYLEDGDQVIGQPAVSESER
ncbi:MAG: efflux RND transporter periplasmic adaptor subunit [Planctomycetota bacterium]